jgi:hypothetical protein
MLKQEFYDYKKNNGQLSFGFDPDENGGCSESCEVYGTE